MLTQGDTASSIYGCPETDSPNRLSDSPEIDFIASKNTQNMSRLLSGKSPVESYSARGKSMCDFGKGYLSRPP